MFDDLGAAGRSPPIEGERDDPPILDEDLEVFQLSLAGLAQGERFTAPGLADLAEVDKFRQARGAFYGKLVAGKPAARYAA